MPFDSRLTDPNDYIDDVQKRFYRSKKVDYGEAFKKSSTEPPFTVNRFGTNDLRRKIQTKKPVLNPRLNFVNDNPEQFKLFTGLPRFDNNRQELYDFDQGRANTLSDFRTYSEYKPIWAELYNVSPTVENPSKNPMPRASNPDPQGNIQARAELEAKAEFEENFTVAELMSGSDDTRDKDKQT